MTEHDSHKEIAEATARFHANVAAVEKGQDPNAVPPSSLEQAAAGAIPVAPVHPAAQSAALAEADRLQAAINPETGRRYYVDDSEYRERVENFRMASLQTPEATAQPATPVEAPIEPSDSPADRVLQHLDDGGEIAQSDVNEGTWSALCADYVVNLKEGYVLNSAHVEMLHNARNAGVSQDVVSRYIREALKE